MCIIRECEAVRDYVPVAPVWHCVSGCVRFRVRAPCALGEARLCRWVSLGAWGVRKGVCVCDWDCHVLCAPGTKCDRASLQDGGEDTHMCPPWGIRTVPEARDT